MCELIVIYIYRLEKKRIDSCVERRFTKDPRKDVPLGESDLEWLRDTRRSRYAQENANGPFVRWPALLQHQIKNIRMNLE